MSYLILKTTLCLGTITVMSAITACSHNNNQHSDIDNATTPLYLLVGSYSAADSAGLKIYKFNPETADHTLACELTGVSNPSYQAINNDGSIIYSVSEDDGREAAACAIAFDRDSCRLSILNFSATEGGAPCYITLSPDNKYVVTANYSGGNITVFPLDSAGLLQAPQVIWFEGKGPIAGRQDHPHPHCVSFTPDSTFMLVSDLGTDRIHRFALEGESCTQPTHIPDTELLTGSGPRHIVWNSTGKQAYLINELSGAITVLDYDGDKLTPRQYIQADSLGAQGSADIHISHDGHHLYASNRLIGDGLAIFSIASDNGMLTRTGYQPTGPHPRNFIISPNDKYILVACRDNNTIEIYMRDTETGLLTPTCQSISTHRPVCLKWL